MSQIKEEIANVTGASVPGTGDNAQVFVRPKAKRGRFAGHQTFIVASHTFNSIRNAKKKGKHWRLYLDEDDSYYDLREYARRKKGAIVIEDERTGACMFVRY